MNRSTFKPMTDEEIAREEELDEYVRTLEEKWEKPRLTTEQLKEVFPEILDIAPIRIRELQFQIEKHEQFCRDNPIFGETLETLWEQERRDEKMKDLRMTLSRFRRFIPSENKNGINDADIQAALEVPILDLFDQPRRSGSLYTDFCPLHDERTPSCKIYPRNNTWWCFGCNQGSSTIDLVMKRDEIDFVTAVKQLKGDL